MTQEMIDDEEHAADFYQHLLKVAEHRKSLFVPVRLICSEDELVKRVKIEERHSAYKAIDVDRAIDLTQRHKVFQSNHPHEITVNNTDIYPGEAAKIIIEHIDAIQRKAADNT